MRSFVTFLILLILFVFMNMVTASPDFDPLNLKEDPTTVSAIKDGNEVVVSSGPSDYVSHHKDGGITLFKFHWEHVSPPLTIALWFFVVTLVKILFHRFEKVHNMLPDSALLIVLGLFFGSLFHLAYPEEVYLKPDFFFLYLLPPIALDAGYFLPNKDFFRNFGTIMTYAVFGTLYNVFAIGLTLYIFSGFYRVATTPIDILLFATLISAVDPVAVLCVFEEIHVNQLLYICVFGESLLNDAVTIVLYQTFGAMVSTDSLGPVDYVKAGSSFFVVSFGGILIGVMWALITGLTTKHAKHLNVVQPLISLLFPYLSYLTSEMVGMSGILAIVMCGLMMKQYLVGNLSRKSLVTVQYFMKTLSSSCEAVIFVYLGVSAVSKNHDWDFLFVSLTIVGCLVHRFIGVLLLTWILNRRRVQKIDVVDQFIMSYGGIRGAVCYGLVMSLNAEEVPAKNMFSSCTVVVILFTVFFQGATIRWLVNFLKVKRNEVHKKTVFEMVSENVLGNMMAGVEAIAGYRGHYWARQLFNNWNDNYIKPFLMSDAKSKAARLIDYNEHIQVKEAVQHLKEYGSFVGMPSVQSRTNLVQTGGLTVPTLGDISYANNVEIEPEVLRARSPVKDSSIPHNQSISVFVRNKLQDSANFNNQLTYGRYSRHVLAIDNLRHLFTNREQPNDENPFDVLDRDSYHMTYPYCKSAAAAPMKRKNRGRFQVRLRSPGPQANDSILPTANDDISAPSSGRPRFMITSDTNDLASAPPNISRNPVHSNSEREVEEGIALKTIDKKISGSDSPKPAQGGRFRVQNSRDLRDFSPRPSTLQPKTANGETAQVEGTLENATSNIRSSSAPSGADEKRSLLTVIEMDENTDSSIKDTGSSISENR